MGARSDFGLTAQQEKFCQAVARGHTLVEAAVMAGYSAVDESVAHKRAHVPKIAARIATIREENRELLKAQRAAEKEALDSGFLDTGVTLKWLLTETKEIMVEARSDGKYRDALSAVEMMAKLAGYLAAHGGGGSDPKKHSLNDPHPSPAVAVQVVNQYAGITDQLARARLEATDIDPAGGTPGDRTSVRVHGPERATPLLECGDGEDAEPLSEPSV